MSHVLVHYCRKRDHELLRSILVSGVRNGFLWGVARGGAVPCLFGGEADGDGHVFSECTFSHLVQSRFLLALHF